MKFSTLIATFKNGLCSPLVRGRKDIDGIESSAEEFTNEWIDSIGATRRRLGTQYSTQHIPNAVNTDLVQNFAFKLLGESYLFSFNQEFFFNAVDATTGLSKYLQILNKEVQVFGGATTGTETIPQFVDFNEADGGVDTGLITYLSTSLNIIQYTQVSDRTVVFTTNNFSFAVSLVNYDKIISGIRRPIETFIMYPYFVNLAQILANQSLASGARKCPMFCTNYPFNFPNTDTTKKLIFSEIAGQSGAAMGSGILSLDTNKFAAFVDIPYSLIPVTFSSFEFFVGSYIRAQTQDSKEAVWFITQGFTDVSHSGELYRRYKAVQTVGGVPLPAGTSVFTISTWYDSVGHPKVTSTYKSRLLFANSGKNTASTVFAAAINNVSPFDYQGMMADTLVQDNSTTDASRMKYYDANNPARRGFSLTFSDGEGQEVRWMMSRRRLHLGTSAGEYQITVNTTFARDTADQIRFGSINSDFTQPVSGDRKIVYTANGGQELRTISVDDRDYESVDIKMNAILSGLNVTFKKIQWFEKMRIVICLTVEGEIYAFSLDTSSQVAGFSQWMFGMQVLDMCCTSDVCFITYKALTDSSETIPNVMAITQLDLEYNKNPNTLEVLKVNHLDVYKSRDIPSLPIDVRGMAIEIAKRIGQCQILFYTNGQKYLTPVLTETSVSTDFTLPPEFIAALQVGEVVMAGVPYKSRIRALPQYQGSQYGSAVGDVHRIDRATIQVYDSGIFKYGSADTPLYDSENLAVGATITKDYTYELPQNSEREQFLVIETDEPTPLNISGVGLRGLSNSGE